MSVKAAGVGHFQIPTAPAAGTSVTSGSANTYTTSAVQLIASTAAALYITGIYAEEAAVSSATYKSVQLMIGGAGAETVIGQYLIAPSTGSTVTRTYRPIFPPIPVAVSTRISAKTADSAGALATLISLEVIAQTNVVDDGVAQSANVTQWNGSAVSAPATAGVPDVNVKNINNVAAATPGASGGVLISGTNAGTTTLGALTVTGATIHTGTTTHTGNVVLSDGLTISAPSTGNRAGLDIAGNGTGAALKLVAGATGVGFSIAGGATSGDGIKVTTTSGHGVNLAPVGTSMHGLFATGGNAGTSDGIKAAAGTGGVDLRAAITGNVTGNLSGSVGSVTGAVGSVTGAVGSVTGAVGSVTGAVGSVTGAVGSVTAAVSVTGDLSATMKTSVTTACTAATPTAAAVTGAVGSVTGNVGGSVASVVGLTAANLDVAVSTRLAAASYTAPDNASVTAIKAKTDSLNFTVAGKLDINTLYVNGVQVIGTGAVGDRWRAFGT